MDEFLVLLQAKLDEAKSKGNVNADIKELQNQLDKLKIQAEIDPKTLSNFAKQLEGVLNQKIVISDIGINQNNITKTAQQTGKEIGSAINQGISSAAKSTGKILRDFSELNNAKRQFVDGHDSISKNDISDAERFYDTVRKAFSEFGQVTINKGEINDGTLDSLRVKIEQVNDEAKITRDFMLYLNQADDFGNTFKLADDDTIRSTEKMIQHLNEEKNIVNVTNEEANAIKEKLAEQEKYYGKLEQASKEQLAIEKQRITAGEKQLEILDAQSKRRDSRISYNEKQIDKKGLSDASKQRKINDLSYSGREKVDVSFAKEIDKNLASLSKLKTEWKKQGIYIDEFKTKVDNLEKSLNEISIGDVKGLNTLKEQLSSLSIEAKELSQIHEIQLLSNGGIKNDYSTQIAKLEGNFRSLGLTEDEIQQKTTNVVSAFDDLKTRVNKPFDESNYQEIISLNDKLQKELIESTNEYTKLQSSTKGFVSIQQRLSKANTIEAWNQKNTAATKDVKAANEAYIASLRDLNSQMTKMQFNEISDGFKKNENSMRALSKLGASFKDQMSQAAQSFTQWLSVSSGVMLLISKTKDAISEIKELDNILTEISKTSDMTSQQLKQLGMDAYDAASKYGRTASDYLLGVQEMARSGFYGEKGFAMAEQSLLAQSAGDMTADLANNYILATNAAYKLNGESDKLNAVLDGQNSITNRNSVAMADMATAMSEAGTVASSYRVSIEDLSAMIGTIESVTKLGGSEVGNAIKAILINLQNVTSDKIVDTLDAANASMTEFVNGAEKLRNPIDILRDLAKTFNQLDEDDPLRAEILTNIGQKYHAAKLGALLQNMEMFDKMLVDYSEGTGSALEESNKSAENLTGTLNKLHNSWTEFVNNIINSDGLKVGVNLINKLVEGATSLTSTFGSLETIGLGAGLFTSIKNVGMAELY